jgi:hypothetical protein
MTACVALEDCLYLGFKDTCENERTTNLNRSKWMTSTNRVLTLCFIFILTVACAISVCAQADSNNRAQSDRGWPRRFEVAGISFAVYQPQVEEWTGNRFSARAAFQVTEQKKEPSYGVLWFTARTEIDKANRLVAFSEFKVTKVNVPSSLDRTLIYQSALQAHVALKGEVISLDRLLADMTINSNANSSSAFDVKNDPPRVFFTTRAAILILIDGNPELRSVNGTNLDRIINTRVLMLQDQSTRKFYLHLMDGWLEASEIVGPWKRLDESSTDLEKALKIASASKQVDLLDGAGSGTQPSLKEAEKQRALPTIYVSTVPAELLQTQGEPEVTAIAGTQLIYVTNTENDIFVHLPTQTHFILIAGRWFQSESMNGPWQFVPAEKLPADFARIPENHAKANVLVSVAGTPQAKEALIANSIPQTATINRKTANLNVTYDGIPRFKSISNTELEYAVNTSVPVIKVHSTAYYAVQNGVWFVATSAVGPWAVATAVPAVIYTIPLSSSLHYVTYVRVYESTPEVVYVGYTPGYYGTVVSTSNVVVYGTGWYYAPYVGTYYWYGAPYTYGYGAAFTWGVATGWGLAYGYGYAWSTYYYPAPYWGPYTYAATYYGRYGWGGVAATNVYGQWGNVAYSGTRAAWANPYTGNVGYGGVYTGTNTVTGTRYAARGGTNTNVYTGTTATGGGVAAYNPTTGRISAGQAGTISNPYTGNSATGARGATYNPQTGVVTGGSAGAVRNGSTGEISAAGSRYAYNTNTNTGVAVGNNNVYATKDGNVYRYNQSSGVQQHTESGWQTVQRSQDRSWVQNQNQARSLGQQRTQNFGSMRGNLGSGGGFKGLGGRRR